MIQNDDDGGGGAKNVREPRKMFRCRSGGMVVIGFQLVSIFANFSTSPSENEVAKEIRIGIDEDPPLRIEPILSYSLSCFWLESRCVDVPFVFLLLQPDGRCQLCRPATQRRARPKSESFGLPREERSISDENIVAAFDASRPPKNGMSPTTIVVPASNRDGGSFLEMAQEIRNWNRRFASHRKPTLSYTLFLLTQIEMTTSPSFFFCGRMQGPLEATAPLALSCFSASQ